MTSPLRKDGSILWIDHVELFAFNFQFDAVFLVGWGPDPAIHSLEVHRVLPFDQYQLYRWVWFWRLCLWRVLSLLLQDGHSVYLVSLGRWLFMTCFQQRRAAQEDDGSVRLDEDAVRSFGGVLWDQSASCRSTPQRGKLKKRSGRIPARKRAIASEQVEQARIDEILAKVKEQGLHSLTWGEKRALKKATERQRQRDIARRGWEGMRME